MNEPMRLRVRVSAPITDVWRALTDPAALRIWLAEHAEVDLPHRYEFWGRHTPDGDRPHQRLRHVSEHSLQFSWLLDDTDTTVHIGLTGDGNETIIALSQTDVPTLTEIVLETSTLAWLHTFWALSIANLVDHLEGREPTARCDFTSPKMREQWLIDAPPQAVYDSIADPEQFSRWFAAKVECEPRIGGRWAMGGFDLDPSPAKIIELAPGRAISLAWDTGMVSSWELSESDGKTRLTFVQSGFDEGNPPYGGWLGWLAGFAELRRYHELPDWRPMWLDVHVPGMPDGMLTID
jgi:uncharacterized protein YndB with AHSA1/START domain